jgi:hypothetical protein
MPAISLADFANQQQDRLRRGVIQKITNESVFFRRLKFIPTPGFAYLYNRQETLGGIAFRGINGSYNADTGVVNPLVETLAIFGGIVQTDRQLVNQSGNGARGSAIAAKVRKAGLFYDKYVIDGDPASDAIQFMGLNSRLTGNQVIAMAANGGPLDLATLNDALDRVPGENSKKIIVCNKFVRRKIKTLLLAQAGAATIAEFGPTLQHYDGAGIEVIDEDGDEAPILGFDETQGSSNVTTSLYVIRPGEDAVGEFVQGLVKSDRVEHVELAMTGVAMQDLIEMAGGLAVFHPRAACRVKGITQA